MTTTHDAPHTIEVTLEVSNWENPKYTLTVNGGKWGFNHRTSKRLTNTHGELFNGIFATKEDVHEDMELGNGTIITFLKGDTEVEVDFGNYWDAASYENPAKEIARRIGLVNAAFDAVEENYTKVWTVEL